MVNLDNLFKIMAEKRISQKQLAVAIQASTGNVSDWKKGRSFPSAQKLDEMATFLECSVDFLIGRTNKPNPEAETGTHIEQNHQFIQNDSSPIVFAMPSGTHLDENQQELLKRFGQLSYTEKIEFMQILISKT